VRRFLLLVVLLVAGCGGDNGDGDGGSPAAAGGDTVEISALDFQFDPARITVDAGATTFTLTNDGQTPHALTIEQDGSEEGTKTISPGESTSVTVELESELLCNGFNLAVLIPSDRRGHDTYLYFCH
jgi:plastocyanin